VPSIHAHTHRLYNKEIAANPFLIGLVGEEGAEKLVKLSENALEIETSGTYGLEVTEGMGHSDNSTRMSSLNNVFYKGNTKGEHYSFRVDANGIYGSKWSDSMGYAPLILKKK
jgi:hypothetical protein